MARIINYTNLQTIQDRIEGEWENFALKYDGDYDPVVPRTIDTDKIEREIERQSNFIDAMIGGFYTVPISAPVNGVIFEWCTILVICKLFHVQNDIPDEYSKQCDMIKEWLTEISQGEKDVPGLTKKSGKAFTVEPHPELYGWMATGKREEVFCA